jgi:RimJ/RimL family protein N-acetyltransferase
VIRLFETSRLSVDEASTNISESDRTLLYADMLKILTPSVVEHLPDYFHGITSIEKAAIWFKRMLCESRLLTVKLSGSDQIIGLMFVYNDNRDAHIGYLLGERFWGVGYAKEVLLGFIEWSKEEGAYNRLIGGVDKTNISSSHLLKGLGFIPQPSSDGSTTFYTYEIR